MRRSYLDVYGFIRRQDELNNLRHDEDTEDTKENEDTQNTKDTENINEKKIDFNNFRECGEFKKDEKRRNAFIEFKEFGECTVCIEFCQNRRDDFDAIRAIREALRVIHESLSDIEKNRICEGIMDIIESINDTKEGVNDIVQVLNVIYK